MHLHSSWCTLNHLHTPSHTFTHLHSSSYTFTHLHTSSCTFFDLHIPSCSTPSLIFIHLHAPSYIFIHIEKFLETLKEINWSSLDSYGDPKNAYNAKSNIRDTWKLLNEILNRKKRKWKICSTFKADDREITDPVEIANKFCSYFSNIGPNLARNIQSSSSHRSFLNGSFTQLLTNRMQYVEFNGHHSSRMEISCGVPQGSILGPLVSYFTLTTLTMLPAY